MRLRRSSRSAESGGWMQAEGSNPLHRYSCISSANASIYTSYAGAQASASHNAGYKTLAHAAPYLVPTNRYKQSQTVRICDCANITQHRRNAVKRTEQTQQQYKTTIHQQSSAWRR